MPVVPIHMKAADAPPADPPANANHRRWRPRLRLGGVMLGIALVAVCLKWPVLAMPILLMLGPRFMGWTGGPEKRRTGWVVLLAMYGPMLPGIVSSELFRTFWAWLWPVWPGGTLLLFGALLGLGMGSDMSSYIVAAAGTLVLFGGASWLAGRGRTWFVATVIACLAASSAAAFIVAQFVVDW